MGILTTAAPLRLTYLSPDQGNEKHAGTTDDQWLTPGLLQSRGSGELSPDPLVLKPLEACTASPTSGVGTQNFWTCITPEEEEEDEEEMAIVAAVSEIFAKRKRKRDKKKRLAKQAARQKKKDKDTEASIDDVI